MGEFADVAPTSVANAIGVLQEHARSGRRAQALAGGTDLLVQLRGADKSPRTIVDVKKIEETNRLDIGSDEIYIGAAIPSALLNENAELKALLPGLVEAADLIGSSQIQGRATLGGNLCNASPAADTTPAMIANRGVQTQLKPLPKPPKAAVPANFSPAAPPGAQARPNAGSARRCVSKRR